MTKKIYLDNAGATPIDPRIEQVVLRHLHESWGNASSVHEAGRRARGVIEDSRKRVARVLGSKSEEIIFTGSGTESDNLAIFGIARAYKKLGRHIITSKIEHHAVLRACQWLEKNENFKVTYLDVKPNGIIDPMVVKKAIKKDTILVSIMYANNEIGTIQPVVEIAKVIRDFAKNLSPKTYHLKPFFHTDACQAAGALNLNVNQLGIDLMTLNGSKIYGPKGVGCLYTRRGVIIDPVIVGGNQERGLRAGTENVPAIAGFAEALWLADKEKNKQNNRLIKLRDAATKEILTKIPGSRLNGDPVLRLPNNISFSFDGLDGEMLVLALDQRGIQISAGAACTSTAVEQSHVIQAIHSQQKLGDTCMFEGNLRITLGRMTTKKDIDYVLKILIKEVARLRS